MSDKALMHEPGINVILDEETGNTIPIEPMINERKTKIEDLKKQLKRANKLDDDQKNDVKDQIDTLFEEIKDLMDTSQKLIVLDNRIILLLDTAQEGLYNTLMSLISQDTSEDQLYQFAEKKSSGKMGAPKNRLRGTPAMFTAQVVDDTRQVRYQEKNRRFIHVIPNTSSDKIKSAISLIGKKYGLLPEEYDEQVVSKNDKERAKVTVDKLVEKLIDHSKLFEPKDSGVRILFNESIAHGVIKDSDDVWAMTVMDRTIRYLSTITKVNMDSRPKIVDTETGRFYPIATFADLKETFELMAMAASTLRPYIADWYNKVFLPTFEANKEQPYELKSKRGYVISSEIRVGINTEQLSEATQKTLGTGKLGSDTILKSYLYPLLNLGYIDKVQSNIDRRSNIYFPIKEGTNISSTFKNEDNLRLEVAEEYYPSKSFLVESMRTFVEYYDRGGMKYKIIDHNGIPIANLDELIDRYLNDAELCFSPPSCSNKKTRIHDNSIEDSSNGVDEESRK
jgi:hypothetical protein